VRRASQISWFAILAVHAACASAHFDGSRFAKESTAYRVGELDPRWQRVSAKGADLAFHRPGHGTISVNATCSGYDDVPAQVLLNHLLFGTTKRRYLLDEEVTIDGRGAQHNVVACELDGVPVLLDMYLIARNGCVFDLDYISGPSAPARREFTRFAQAFQIERVRRD
jgi:hypothetical protein